MKNYILVLVAIACLTASSFAAAPGYQGQVTFNGFAIPGATVTATQGEKTLVAVSDERGIFSFPDITNGTWTIQVEMSGFTTLKDQLLIGQNAPAAPPWELKMLPIDDMKAETRAMTAAPPSVAPAPKTEEPKPPVNSDATKPPAKGAAAKTPAKPDPANPQATKPADATAPPAAAAPEEPDQRAADGFLINGSVNNGAASPFAQLAAFGNNRNGGRSLYNGGIGMILDNSALDARPFSQSGQVAAKTAYNRITGLFNFGGPLKIPHLLKNGPVFNVQYQWTRNNNDLLQSGIVPTLAERGGDLSAVPALIFNPTTGLPFAGNQIPVSSQALTLLNLFPKPNTVPTSTQPFNYQTPIISNTHQDALQTRLNKTFHRKETISGGFAFSSTRTSNPNLFGFVDTIDSLGINTNVSWTHRFSQHVVQTVGARFSRSATTVIPNFANRVNISGDAGISGNNQEPTNFGPPALSFSSLTGLSDAQSAHNRNQTSALSYGMVWNRRNHTFQFGGDFRRQEFNYLSQQDPRGSFGFTGTATQQVIAGAAQPNTGSDIADFLLGIPDSSSIAFGNADKYFRQSVYDAYINDDWRVNPQLTVNAGLRWEYGAPITELFGRLVNLDIVPGFSAVSPVIANNPVGTLTGQTYPGSLLRPDKAGFSPKIGISWRPISGSSILVKAGYGINFDTSVYQSIALLMAQQSPLSKSLSVSNSATCPLTMANGFNPCSITTANTFAVDPNFRVGYVQTWQLSVQRDLPWSLQGSITYLGIKGTRGMQEFLPNTVAPPPPGTVVTNPCPTCPVGFAFLTSNGNSTREAGQAQLRRRLRAGLTATLQYTYSKSIDDDSSMGNLGGSPIIAQDWHNLRGQRGLSSFDQRHLVSFTWQYSTGMGLGGKTLMSGWKGRLYKEWTLLSTVTYGTGLPLTPIVFGPSLGTGFSGVLRPNLVGNPTAVTSSNLFLNAGAYSTVPNGLFGNAGRDSITGPSQFSLNASMQRSFHLKDRYSMDLTFSSTNLLNHVVFSSYNTFLRTNVSAADALAQNPLFGTAINPNQMRVVKTTLRLRF